MSETKNVTPQGELRGLQARIWAHHDWVKAHNLDNLFNDYLNQLIIFLSECSDDYVFNNDNTNSILKHINIKMGRFAPILAEFNTLITDQLGNLHKLISKKVNSEYNEPQAQDMYNKLLSKLEPFKKNKDENKEEKKGEKESIDNFRSTTASDALYLNENDRKFIENLYKQTDDLLDIFTKTVTTLTEFKENNNLGVLFPRQHYESSNRSNNFYASSSQSGSNNSRNMTTSNTSNTIDNTRLLEQYKALKRNVENEIAQGRHGLYSESTIEELQELSKSIQSILKGKNTKFLEQASLNDFNAQFRGILMDQFIYLYTEIDSKRTNPAFSNIEKSLNNLSEKVKGYYNDNNGKHDLPVSELKNALKDFKEQYHRELLENKFLSLFREIDDKRKASKYSNIKNSLTKLANNMYNYCKIYNNNVTVDDLNKTLNDYIVRYQFLSLYSDIRSNLDNPKYSNIKNFLKTLKNNMADYYNYTIKNNNVTVDVLNKALDDFNSQYDQILNFEKQFELLYSEIQSTCEDSNYSYIHDRLTELKEKLNNYYNNYNFNNNNVTIDDLNNELYAFKIGYRESIIEQLYSLVGKISNEYWAENRATKRTDLYELLNKVYNNINEAADDINVTAETLKNSYNNFLDEFNNISDNMIITTSYRNDIYNDSKSQPSITQVNNTFQRNNKPGQSPGKGKSPYSPRMRQGSI